MQGRGGTVARWAVQNAACTGSHDSQKREERGEAYWILNSAINIGGDRLVMVLESIIPHKAVIRLLTVRPGAECGRGRNTPAEAGGVTGSVGWNGLRVDTGLGRGRNRPYGYCATTLLVARSTNASAIRPGKIAISKGRCCLGMSGS
jgi:hypothetical protein